MAATTSCCDASGGRTTITAGGTRWSARSAIQIYPTQFERTLGANQDGTIYSNIRPMPAEADFSLSDSCGLDINAIMACPVDVTFDLIDMRRKYLFTGAVIHGRPEINTETGEIRGLKCSSNTVTIVNY